MKNDDSNFILKISKKDNKEIIDFLKRKIYKEYSKKIIDIIEINENNNDKIEFKIIEDYLKNRNKIFDKKFKIDNNNYKEKKKKVLSYEEIERFFGMSLAIIGNFWIKFFQDNFGINIKQPDLIFYKGQIEIENKKINYPIFYYPKDNNIYINKDKISNLLESEIGFTLTIAHEILHSIEYQLGLILSKKDAEFLADFIAGYTLKYFEDEGLTDKKDIEKALKDFEKLGILSQIACDIQNIENIHGNGEERKQAVLSGFNTNKVILKNLITSLLIKSIKNLDNENFIKKAS